MKAIIVACGLMLAGAAIAQSEPPPLERPPRISGDNNVDSYRDYRAGMSCFAQQSYDCAIMFFTRAIGLQPDFANIYPLLAYEYFYRGLSFYRRGDPEGALGDYDHVVRLEPDWSVTYNARGAAYMAKQNWDDAIKEFDNAVRLKSDFIAAIRNRGIAHRRKGELDLAVEDYSHVLRLSPRDVSTLADRAIAYTALHDADRALDDWNTLSRFNPNGAAELNNLCWAQGVIMRELEGALANCDKAIALDPTSPSAYDSRGVIYFRLGRFTESVADFNEALKKDPNQTPSLYMRGLAEVRLNNLDSGNRDIAAAKALRPDIEAEYVLLGLTASQ